MARQKRDGLLYFPFDTDFFYADTKIRALQARYGSDGLMFYIFLLTEIYRENGYYIVWNADSEDSAMASLGLSEGSMKQIMTFLASRSLIIEITLASPDTIITSPGIQRRFQEAVKRLKRDFVVDSRIWLLKEEDTAPCIKVTLFEDNSQNYTDKSEKNEDKSEIYTIKERKGKEKKGNEREGTPAKPYGQFGNVMLLDDEYIKLADKYGADIRNEAIEFLDMYIEEKGYKTKSHYLAIIRWVVNAVNERKQKSGRSYQIKGNAFTNFSQTNLSSELDEMEALFHQEVNGIDKGRKN